MFKICIDNKGASQKMVVGIQINKVRIDSQWWISKYCIHGSNSYKN